MRFLSLLVLLSLLSACGLLLDTDPNGNGRTDGGIGADGASDAWVDGSADAAPDAPMCVPQAEACANAVDDDCDGMVDEGCDCDAYVLMGGTGDGTERTSPSGSIQTGIDLVAGLDGGIVCVAAVQQPDGSCYAGYDETVSMYDGVDVIGGYRPAADGWVTDDLCRTTIQTDGLFTVDFPTGVTDETLLARMYVEGPSDGADSIGVRFTGGGRLQDVIAKAGDVNNRARGVVVSDTSSERVLIFDGYMEGATGISALESIGLSIRNREVEVYGSLQIVGTDAERTVGVHAEGATLTIDGVDEIRAGLGTSQSLAVQLANCPSVTIRNIGSIHAGRADASAGIVASGTTNVTVENVASIAGGGGYTEANGLLAEEGAQLVVDRVAEIVGRDGGDPNIEAYRGVFCDGTMDADTNCVIEHVDRLVGVERGGMGSGIGAEFKTCTGSLHDADVTGNLNDGQLSTSVVVRDALGVDVDANIIDERRSGSAPNHGILVVDSLANVHNNYVRVAGRANALQLRAFEVGALVATVHSNTFVGEMSGAAAATPTIGLMHVQGPTSASDAGDVTLRHNIFLCSPVDLSMTAVVEFELNIRRIGYNMFHGCQRAWNDRSNVYEPSDPTFLPWLNARPQSAGNTVDDPLLDSSGHLMSGSPAIDSGRSEGAPPFDFEDDDRPLIPGGVPDIGCDEAE